MDVDVEIVSPKRHRRRPSGFMWAGPLGLFGALFAGGTAISAMLLVVLFLFGRILLVSAAVTLLWPAIFSPEFTLWVFGAAKVPFHKILLLFALAEIVLYSFRRGLRG
ncbi:hypothetical protein ACFL2T_05260 [Elusimicrobiota bacterium]